MTVVAPSSDDRDSRRPGDTDRHRQQRNKNLFMFFFLLGMAAIFFALTIVRMGEKG